MDKIQLFAVKNTDFKLRFILDGYCFSRGQTADTFNHQKHHYY